MKKHVLIYILVYCFGYCIDIIMATHNVPDTLPKPALAFCKKCNADHEKPVGNKCDRIRNINKEKKRKSNCQTTMVKKTPQGKTSDSHDKVLDIMMSTMNYCY